MPFKFYLGLGVPSRCCQWARPSDVRVTGPGHPAWHWHAGSGQSLLPQWSPSRSRAHCRGPAAAASEPGHSRRSPPSESVGLASGIIIAGPHDSEAAPRVRPGALSRPGPSPSHSLGVAARAAQASEAPGPAQAGHGRRGHHVSASLMTVAVACHSEL